jgi:hypothetical protein
VKFVVVLAVLITIGYVGYLYVPVAVRAFEFRDYMQTMVDQASGLGKPADWVTAQLKSRAAEYDVPTDALISSTQTGGRVETRVQFKKDIAFPGYTYTYVFDYTVKSTTLLDIK